MIIWGKCKSWTAQLQEALEIFDVLKNYHHNMFKENFVKSICTKIKNGIFFLHWNFDYLEAILGVLILCDLFLQKP